MPVGDDVRPIALHSSWRGRLTFTLGPLLLFLWGLYGIIVGGLQIINGALAGIGLVTLMITALDFPIRSVLSSDGIERCCLLRTEAISWDRIRGVARPARTGITGRIRSGLGHANSSGLVVEVGKRAYLLVDRLESPAEYDAVERALGKWRPGMVLRASRPVDGTAPTWMYKRRLGPDPTSLVDEL